MGGGCAARLSLLLSFPCLADHGRRNYPPPCNNKKVVFRVGNQYAGCQKQQNNGNSLKQIMIKNNIQQQLLRTGNSTTTDDTQVVFFLVCSYSSFVSPSLWPMGLSVLGYESHLLLQRCHPACGHEGSSNLSPVLALQNFTALQVQHSYNSSTTRWIILPHVL